MGKEFSTPPVRTTLQDLLRQKQVPISPLDGNREPLSEDDGLQDGKLEKIKNLLFHHGVDALKTGQPCCAERLFKVLLTLDPDHLKAKLNLSVAFSKQGDQEGAATILEKVLEQDPENTIAKRNLRVLRQQ